ncbi:pyrimidine 5-nucleotidase [Auriculariales sp. MPI-PUGE-AT-0066]|nr:pyrimidine 5-nucleotidase [Auriculariales sp. MPI-PUGE-AT-0066]
MSTSPSEKWMVWLDIDNTLYKNRHLKRTTTASTRIAAAMTERIHAFFVTLGLPEDEAHELHMRYYKEYGLAIRGLMKHHGIDGLVFDRACDQTLPLEEALRPDPAIRKLLEDIDRSKARVWALTNAYSIHANRVLNILNLRDLVEDIVFCDYTMSPFPCKPELEFYQEAMQRAGVTDPSRCLFVDDSLLNCRAAKQLGWGHVVWFCEDGTAKISMHGPAVEDPRKVEGVDAVVFSILELRDIWSFVFKTEG